MSIFFTQIVLVTFLNLTGSFSLFFFYQTFYKIIMRITSGNFSIFVEIHANVYVMELFLGQFSFACNFLPFYPRFAFNFGIFFGILINFFFSLII